MTKLHDRYYKNKSSGVVVHGLINIPTQTVMLPDGTSYTSTEILEFYKIVDHLTYSDNLRNSNRKYYRTDRKIYSPTYGQII